MPHPGHRRHRAGLVLAGTLLLAACGDSSAGPGSSTPAAPALTVAVQNSTLLPGVNRLSIALLENGKAVLGATVRLDVYDSAQHGIETEPMQFIGPGYGNIPVYLGAAAFPTVGTFHLVTHAALTDGNRLDALTDVTVTNHSPELPVGHSVTEVASRKQAVARDVGGDLSKLDSGIKDGRADPDPFHDYTIQDGLDMRKPMILYFGQPGYCATETCGPTVQVLDQIYAQYKDRILFEHIEVKLPPGGSTFNPVLVGFGLTTEPWVFLVNDKGIVADRFEGPLTVEQLRAAVDGTLAGKVPAVEVKVVG